MHPSLQKAIRRRIRALAVDQRGATAIEYALIASLISVAILGAVMLLGNTLENTYGNIRDEVVAATASVPEE